MILRPTGRRRTMTTLSAFLAQARAALAAPPGDAGTTRPLRRPLTFVVGNESADLDSLCSALVLAYFKSQPALTSPSSSSSSSSSSAPQPATPRQPSGTLHIPLCNLARADLVLRPELTAVLRGAALTPDDVLTLDDLPPSTSPDSPPSTSSPPPPPPSSAAAAEAALLPVLKPEDTRWVLVDHNVPTGRLAREYTDKGGVVVGCIDHHEDEGRLPRAGDCDPRVVEKSGSCMSLIVEHCRAAWDDAASSSSSSGGQSQEQQKQQQQEQKQLDNQLAHLILAPILIDTNNLRDANKTTSHDTKVVEYVEQTKVTSPFFKGEGDAGGSSRYDRDAYFSHISAIKSDISAMSLRDILRKDYKEWTEDQYHQQGQQGQQLRLGTMSVPQPMAYLLEHTCRGDRDALLRGLAQWTAEKQLDIASIMTAYEDAESGGFARDLFLWAPAARGGKKAEEEKEEKEDGSGDVGGGKGVDAAKRFVERHGDELKLITWREGLLDSAGAADDVDGFRRCWTQGTLKNSRKQIAPMLRGAMRGAA
ncbi:exopolyphosphatase [Microdochium nivale]|nr:exopolyphosphatase [Microdochium nivale]